MAGITPHTNEVPSNFSLLSLTVRSTIVSRGDWLWNPANFKGWSLCLGFSLVTWSQPCATVMLRWRPEYCRHQSSNQKFWFLAVEFAVNLSNIVMPGDNCFMFGCGTSRRTKGVGIWKLPNAKDEDHKKNMEGRYLARGNYEDKRSWSLVMHDPTSMYFALNIDRV